MEYYLYWFYKNFVNKNFLLKKKYLFKKRGMPLNL